MTRQRRLAIFRFIFWFATILAFVMAILPHPPQMPGAPSDKVQHIMAFLALGALAFIAYPRASPFYLATALSIFGGVIELVQLIPALHRDGDPLDWIADTAAAALILIFLHRLRSRRRRTRAGEG